MEPYEVITENRFGATIARGVAKNGKEITITRLVLEANAHARKAEEADEVIRQSVFAGHIPGCDALDFDPAVGEAGRKPCNCAVGKHRNDWHTGIPPEEFHSDHYSDKIVPLLIFSPEIGRVTFGQFNKALREFQIDGSPSRWKVTHWMPMPAIPSPETRERLAFVARRGDSPVESVNEDPQSTRFAALRELQEKVRRLEAQNRRLAIANPPRVTAELLGQAMDFIWNDHCGDAGTVPDCISIHGPRTTTVEARFAGTSFVDRVAEYLSVKTTEGDAEEPKRLAWIQRHSATLECVSQEEIDDGDAKEGDVAGWKVSAVVFDEDGDAVDWAILARGQNSPEEAVAVAIAAYPAAAKASVGEA